jgi:glutamine amidotransferase
VQRARDPRLIEQADRIVLPGVGTFAAAMRNLDTFRQAGAIREAAARDVPFLGACLGMQLMAARGTEGVDDGAVEGLGLLDGEVTKLCPRDERERVPHIGWNDVSKNESSVLFAGVPSGTDFYFVHSYHMTLADRENEAGRTDYCGGIVAAVELKGRPIFGTQFHPEKSQSHGFALLRNFLAV